MFFFLILCVTLFLTTHQTIYVIIPKKKNKDKKVTPFFNNLYTFLYNSNTEIPASKDCVLPLGESQVLCIEKTLRYRMMMEPK